MSKISLKNRILNYCRKNSGHFIPSGQIQRLVTERTKYSAANATRRLRELCADGFLEVKYVKTHAYYRYIPQMKTIEEVEVHGNTAYKVTKTIEV